MPVTIPYSKIHDYRHAKAYATDLVQELENIIDKYQHGKVKFTNKDINNIANLRRTLIRMGLVEREEIF